MAIGIIPQASPIALSGAFNFIEEITPSGVGTITFSNLGEYTHLEIRFTARASTVTTAVNLEMRFNGDTGANYDRQLSQASNTTFTGQEALAQTSAAIASIAASTATAGRCGIGIIRINNYRDTTFNKMAVCENGFIQGTTTGLTIVKNTTIGWRSTAAITSITLFLASGNFEAGTKFTLYGLRYDASAALPQFSAVWAKNTESIANDTIQNDNELFLPVYANSIYIVRLFAAFTSGTNAGVDVKFGFTFPSGVIDYAILGYNGTATANTELAWTTPTIASTSPTQNSRGVISTAASASSPVSIDGTLRVGVTGGTLQFRWAQNVTTGGDPLVRQIGAYLSLQRIG